MKSSKEKFTEYLFKISNGLSSSLLYTHTRINDNTKKTLEAASFLYALIEPLNGKGLNRRYIKVYLYFFGSGVAT